MRAAGRGSCCHLWDRLTVNVSNRFNASWTSWEFHQVVYGIFCYSEMQSGRWWYGWPMNVETTPFKILGSTRTFLLKENPNWSKPYLCKFMQLCNDNRIAHCIYWRATGILFSANFSDSTYHSKIPYQSLPIRVVILCQGWLMGILKDIALISLNLKHKQFQA